LKAAPARLEKPGLDRAEEGLCTRLATDAWAAGSPDVGGALLKTIVDAGVPVLVFVAMVVGIATAIAVKSWAGSNSQCSRQRISWLRCRSSSQLL
jgi:hypothetical protein